MQFQIKGLRGRYYSTSSPLRLSDSVLLYERFRLHLLAMRKLPQETFKIKESRGKCRRSNLSATSGTTRDSTTFEVSWQSI